MEAGAVTASPVPARVAYRQELTALAASDDRIVCLEADLGGARHPFQHAHPDRFFNFGIAEAAMMDAAVGMAAYGLRPFVSTFAGFAALRAAESIKLGLGYAGAPVVIVAPYAGYSGAWLGTTHHCAEDFAVLQSLPGVRIAAPFGEAEMRAVIRNTLLGDRPHFIRTGRNDAYDSEDMVAPGRDIESGAWLADGGGVCLVSIGEKATQFCLDLTNDDATLAHLHLCYVDAEAQQQCLPRLEEHTAIVVVEEHRRAGSIASTLALSLPSSNVVSFSLNDSWVTHAGSHDDVLAEGGFSKDRLVDVVDQLSRNSTLTARRSR